MSACPFHRVLSSIENIMCLANVSGQMWGTWKMVQTFQQRERYENKLSSCIVPARWQPCQLWQHQPQGMQKNRLPSLHSSYMAVYPLSERLFNPTFWTCTNMEQFARDQLDSHDGSVAEPVICREYTKSILPLSLNLWISLGTTIKKMHCIILIKKSIQHCWIPSLKAMVSMTLILLFANTYREYIYGAPAQQML